MYVGTLGLVQAKLDVGTALEEVTHGALESTVEVRKDKSLRLPQGLGFAGQLAVHPYLSHVVQPFAGTLRQLAKGVDDERSEEVSTVITCLLA